jgi:tRNA (guanine6-N2)-methyltransferase
MDCGKSYYSTFVTGLIEPVKDALIAAIPDCKITLALDGLIAYESKVEVELIKSFPFVTNSFYIIKSFDSETDLNVSNMAANIMNDSGLRLKLPVKYNRRNTFRVITSVSNQLVPIDAKLMKNLEKQISNKTGLRPYRAKPDFEFWISQRSEGHGFFAFRLSYHKAYDKMLQKGELRPELANILCRLSEPLPDELFLDPFCGSGAIPIQRAKFFPKGLVIASEIDEQKIFSLKDRVKALDLTKRLVARQDDALNLTRYQDGVIHKIVTDPPWGHFVQLSSSTTDFYNQMLTEFTRILRPDGRIVILTGETLAFESCLLLFPTISLTKKFSILLSGKKASIYVLIKAI